MKNRSVGGAPTRRLNRGEGAAPTVCCLKNLILPHPVDNHMFGRIFIDGSNKFLQNGGKLARIFHVPVKPALFYLGLV